MQVNIGDYIREVHGDYEGIVKTIKGNVLEVEIEEGFIVPLAKSNIVVVSSNEKEYFHNISNDLCGNTNFYKKLLFCRTR